MKRGKIEKKALKILKTFPEWKNQPASLSLKYHHGEVMKDHLERCVSIMRHLCDAHNIHGSDRDMLIACAYLHDIGRFIIAHKGKIKNPLWRYYNKSKYSRIDGLMEQHGPIGKLVLKDMDIPRAKEIGDIIETHMGHWYKNTPEATTFYQKLLITADYLATQKEIFNYNGEREWNQK